MSSGLAILIDVGPCAATWCGGCLLCSQPASCNPHSCPSPFSTQRLHSTFIAHTMGSCYPRGVCSLYAVDVHVINA